MRSILNFTYEPELESKEERKERNWGIAITGIALRIELSPWNLNLPISRAGLRKESSIYYKERK